MFAAEYVRPRKQARKDIFESSSSSSTEFLRVQSLQRDLPSYNSSPVTAASTTNSSSSTLPQNLANRNGIHSQAESDDSLYEFFASQCKSSKQYESEQDMQTGSLDSFAFETRTFVGEPKSLINYCDRKTIQATLKNTDEPNHTGIRTRPASKKGIDHLPRNVGEMISHEQSFQIFMRRRRIISSARGVYSYEDESNSEYEETEDRDDDDDENDSDYSNTEVIRKKTKNVKSDIDSPIEYEPLVSRIKTTNGYAGMEAGSNHCTNAEVELEKDIFETLSKRRRGFAHKDVVPDEVTCTSS